MGLDWPLDFYLWGFVKNSIYRARLKTIEEVKEAVVHCISNIDTSTLKKVCDNFVSRLQKIVEEEGSHIEHI